MCHIDPAFNGAAKPPLPAQEFFTNDDRMDAPKTFRAGSTLGVGKDAFGIVKHASVPETREHFNNRQWAAVQQEERICALAR